jgi:hypothetical protein
MLPEVALLEIFRFYVDTILRMEAWQILGHVWRNIVFRSRRHLDLRLECGTRKPVRELLDV